MAWLEDEASIEAAREAALLAALPADQVRQGGIAAALKFLENQVAAASLLVDVSNCEDVLQAMNRLADACEPGTRVVALGSVNDIETYRQLLELGVSDYLVKPATPEALARALNRSRSPAPVAHDESRASYRSVAVIGTRGGCGATSIAVAVACALAHRHERRTLLVDLDLQLGSAALSLDLEASKGIREILSNPDRIDSLLIKSALVQESERLSVLSGEEPLESPLHVGGEGLKSLLKWVEEDRDVVVMDVCHHLDSLGRAALDCCDLACLVTDLSLAAMRDCNRLLKLLADSDPDRRVLVVANKVGGVPGEVPQSEFERGIGAKFDFVLPFDTQASASAADQGKSLLAVAEPGPFASELNRLVDFVAGIDTASPRAAKRSWFQRLAGA